MKIDEDKTKAQLIKELRALRKRVAELERLEAGYKRVEKTISKLTFSELVDIQQLQKLLELYFKNTNIPVAILDSDGNSLVAAGMQDICTQFHHNHPVTFERCQQSNAFIKSYLDEGRHIEYKCKNGLWDLAVPIFIAGEHMATLFIGQFFYEDEHPDTEFFRGQAEKFGFNVEKYLEALQRVPVFSREKVQSVIEYYSTFVELLSIMGYSNLLLAQDIEKWKKVEDELRKLEKAVETMQLGVTITDTEGKIVYTNPAEARMHGYRVEDLLGKDVGIFAPPESRQPMTLDQIKNMENLVRESFNIQKNGSIFPVRLITDVVKNAEGTPIAMVTICEDITERKRTEETLQKSEERLLEAQRIAHVGSLEWDIVQNKVWWSDELYQIYGYKREQFTPSFEMFFEHIHPDDREYVKKNIEALLSQDKPYIVEYRIVLHDSSIRFIHAEAQLYRDVDGQPVRTIGTVQDITERKQLQLALEEERASLAQKVEARTAELSQMNAELARAARLKDEFLANMSHELRTPLNVILGISESLQEEVYGTLNERQLKALHAIEESGYHLLALINDILDLSRIGAGKLELNLVPVSVAQVCQAALQFIKQPAQKKRLNVSSMFDSHVTIICADGRRLKQILINLLNNAVKFTPEGGTIGLEVKGDVERCVVHFVVWDTGIGIAQEDMKRLFQPFVQLDASLSRKYTGAGLGLSLVYRMVEMHGGSVSVESKVGKGSRFTVSFPWQETDPFSEEEKQAVMNEEQEPEDKKDPAPCPSDIKSRTILIAEDNEATIDTLSGYFTAKGYRVMIARNGWEAFAHTKEYHPDIIVMDIQMPEMDGLEAIRHIRADKNGEHIPIIALTVLTMPGDREKCLLAGADEYFSKPVSLRGLARTIERLLH